MTRNKSLEHVIVVMLMIRENDYKLTKSNDVVWRGLCWLKLCAEWKPLQEVFYRFDQCSQMAVWNLKGHKWMCLVCWWGNDVKRAPKLAFIHFISLFFTDKANRTHRMWVVVCGWIIAEKNIKIRVPRALERVIDWWMSDHANWLALIMAWRIKSDDLENSSSDNEFFLRFFFVWLLVHTSSHIQMASK